MTSDFMGKVVLVDRIFERQGGGYEYRERWWKDVPAEGRPGWIVGERWLQAGSVYLDSECGPSWERKPGRATHCLLVAYWPTMRPVRVPLDSYRLAPETVKPYPSEFQWTESARKYVSVETKNQPRDEKGRWRKK